MTLLVTASVEQVAAAGAAAEVIRRTAAADGSAPVPDTVRPRTADAAGRGAGAAGGSAGVPDAPHAAECVGRAAGLAALDRHGPIGPHLLAYLACCATLTTVLLDADGQPLDVGRTRRLATAAQRKALAVRDRGCVIPSCACPHAGTDAHHSIPWEHGGPTNLDNLVSLCPAHHQQVHAGIWAVTIKHGIPWVRPPSWVDPQRRWTRNLLHHSHQATRQVAQQLRLALDEDAAERGVRRMRPIDRSPWPDTPPDDDHGPPDHHQT